MSRALSRRTRPYDDFFTTSTTLITLSADFFNIAFSSSLNATSTIFSTPPAPITHGTPMTLLPTPHPSSGLRPCGRWPLPSAVLGGRHDAVLHVGPPARGAGGEV